MNKKFTLTDMCVNEVLKQFLEMDVLIQLKESDHKNRIRLFEEHIYYPIAILLADKFTWYNDYHPIIVEYWPIDLLPLDSCNIHGDKYLLQNIEGSICYSKIDNEFIVFFNKWICNNTDPISLAIMTIIIITCFMSDLKHLLSAASFNDLELMLQDLKEKLSNEELNNYVTFKTKISTKVKDIENNIKLLE